MYANFKARVGEDGLMDKATFETELAGLVGASKQAQSAIHKNKMLSGRLFDMFDRNGDGKVNLAGDGFSSDCCMLIHVVSWHMCRVEVHTGLHCTGLATG